MEPSFLPLRYLRLPGGTPATLAWCWGRGDRLRCRGQQQERRGGEQQQGCHALGSRGARRRSRGAGSGSRGANGQANRQIRGANRQIRGAGVQIRGAGSGAGKLQRSQPCPWVLPGEPQPIGGDDHAGDGYANETCSGFNCRGPVGLKRSLNGGGHCSWGWW